MPSGQQIGSTAGSIGGAALGNALLPGVGGFIGGSLGGLVGGGLGGLFGGGPKQPTPEEMRRQQLEQLAARLNAQAAQDPYQTAGYRARVGEARDAAREDAQGDAARATTLGLSPGFATAAGAGNRARALAGVERAAVGDAEGRQMQLQGLAASLLAGNADREAQAAALRRQQRGSFLSGLGNLAVQGAGAYLDYRSQGRKPTV